MLKVGDKIIIKDSDRRQLLPSTLVRYNNTFEVFYIDGHTGLVTIGDKNIRNNLGVPVRYVVRLEWLRYEMIYELPEELFTL